MNLVPETHDRKKRPFSLPASHLRVDGEVRWSLPLSQALSVPGLPENIAVSDRPLVERSLGPHLFHSYAGRTHPLLVRRLCEDLRPGQTLLDPFIGSGTVAIEGVRKGLRVVGCDVSPLAVRLSLVKSTPLPVPMQKAMLMAAQKVCEASWARVKKKLSPPHNYDRAEHYAPHVYLELCGLRYEIGHIVSSDAPIGEWLLMIFSAIVLKCSNQRSETSERIVDRQIGKGQVTKWFLKKTEEVIRLEEAFWTPDIKTQKPNLFVGDARTDLLQKEKTKISPNTVDRVITSPPYLGTYDYLQHHARRYAWLGIDPSPIERNEMAARRQTKSLSKRLREHEADTWNWLSACEKWLASGGHMLILVGDSVVEETLCDGAEPICRAAESTKLRVVASASVERPHAVSTSVMLPPRREHLLVLERT